MSNPTAIVFKLWNYCSPATAGRDDGLPYRGYRGRRLSVIAVTTTNLQRATRLRQSILQKAFTGEF